MVLPKYRTAIFVHGCFWHRHAGCKVATTPKSNTDFWLRKFGRNVERDQEHSTELQRLGWNVMVVWECEVRSPSLAGMAAERLAKGLRNGAQ